MDRRDAVRDAMEARRRCLEAMATCADEETRRSLWRAALRYAERARGELTPLAGLEIRQRGHARLGARQGARAFE